MNFPSGAFTNLLKPFTMFQTFWKSMKCQANMEENSEENRFGLEVIFFSSASDSPENTNYKYKVGSSVKPRLIRPGKISVELKSSYFEADTDAGEEEQLIKDHDYDGEEFLLQFACKFKPDIKIERGTFGKVVVKRDKLLLFEFNIQKSGYEGLSNVDDPSESWSALAIHELAGNLSLNEGKNWKQLAKALGFTKNEIKSTFKNSPDRFSAMRLIYQARGGTANEFVRALFTVHRQIRENVTLENKTPQKKRSKAPFGVKSPLNFGYFVTSFDDTSESSTPIPSTDSELSQDIVIVPKKSRKRLLLKPLRKTVKRQRMASVDSATTEIIAHPLNKNSFVVHTDESSNESDRFRNDATRLEQSFLWEISSQIGDGWRPLGRTLGINESTLIDIDHSNKGVGFRECAFQMLNGWKQKFPKHCTFGNLYLALCKENMNLVAKKMIYVRRNEGP